MPSYDKSNNGTICRHFVNGKCKYGDTCRLYHPNAIQINTLYVQKEIKRKPGQCYCGAYLRTILNRSPLLTISEDKPKFFMICTKTGRSMYKCR